MEYISIKGAAQRLGMTEKEVNKLVQEGQLSGKTSYGVTTVTKESVYAYTGLSTDANQTKKKGKGGRPPAGVSYEEAAEMLGEDIPELVGMRKLETYNTGKGFIITKRSIKAYKAKLADQEAKEMEEMDDADSEEVEEITLEDEPKCANAEPDTEFYAEKRGENVEYCSYPACSCPIDLRPDDFCGKGFELRTTQMTATLTDDGSKNTYECNDNFDMEEERAINEGRTPSEYETKGNFDVSTWTYPSDHAHIESNPCEIEDAGEVEEEQLLEAPSPDRDECVADDSDMHILEDREGRNYFDNEEHKRKCIENEKWQEAKAAKEAEELKAKEGGLENAEETITISKHDFHASLTVAAMRAELQVYRSLKSFERR